MRVVYFTGLALLMCAQAMAVTIPQGQYQTKWRSVTRYQDACYRCDINGELEPLAKAKGLTITGAVSSDALWARCGKIFVVLDERKGTGKGFDTAYLLTNVPETGAVDMKTAVPAPLIKDDYSEFGTDSEDPPVVQWTMGAPDHQVTKPAGVHIRVYTQRGEGGRQIPGSVSMMLLGRWETLIDTPNGPIQIQMYDVNANGLCDDAPGGESGGDGVVIRHREESPGRSSIDMDVARLAGVTTIDHKLYIVKASSVGDRVDIKPYIGDTAKLKVEARDAFGNEIKWKYLSLNGPAGQLSFAEDQAGGFDVPLGEYRISAEVFPRVKSSKGKGDPNFEFALNVCSANETSSQKLTVTKDQPAVCRLGGPLGMVVTDRSRNPITTDVINISKSKADRLVIEFTLGGLCICGYQGMESAWKPVITVRDSAGKAVYTSGGEEALSCMPLQIGKDWPVGKYTLEVKVDPELYQKPLSVTRTLLITE